MLFRISPRKNGDMTIMEKQRQREPSVDLRQYSIDDTGEKARKKHEDSPEQKRYTSQLLC